MRWALPHPLASIPLGSSSQKGWSCSGSSIPGTVKLFAASPLFCTHLFHGVSGEGAALLLHCPVHCVGQPPAGSRGAGRDMGWGLGGLAYTCLGVRWCFRMHGGAEQRLKADFCVPGELTPRKLLQGGAEPGGGVRCLGNTLAGAAASPFRISLPPSSCCGVEEAIIGHWLPLSVSSSVLGMVLTDNEPPRLCFRAAH